MRSINHNQSLICLPNTNYVVHYACSSVHENRPQRREARFYTLDLQTFPSTCVSSQKQSRMKLLHDACHIQRWGNSSVTANQWTSLNQKDSNDQLFLSMKRNFTAFRARFIYASCSTLGDFLQQHPYCCSWPAFICDRCNVSVGPSGFIASYLCVCRVSELPSLAEQQQPRSV